MPSRPFNIDKYNTLLKSEVTKLTVILIVLFILFVCVIILSINQKKRNKKAAYVQLVLTLIIFPFLLVSLITQIGSFNKDITSNAYIQYEGPVSIQTKKQLILGGINSAYTEYIISFEYRSMQYELSVNKNYGFSGNTDNLYIVFSEHSKYILEIEK